MTPPAPTAPKSEWRAWARTLPPVVTDVATAVGDHVCSLLVGIDGVVLGYRPLADEVGIDVRVGAIALLDAAGDLELRGDDGPVEPADIDAVLVPARVFDRDGYRLGRGGGHYDRLVPRLRPGVPVIGVTCEARLVDRLPREVHDAPMTHLATEHGVRELDA